MRLAEGSSRDVFEAARRLFFELSFLLGLVLDFESRGGPFSRVIPFVLPLVFLRGSSGFLFSEVSLLSLHSSSNRIL